MFIVRYLDIVAHSYGISVFLLHDSKTMLCPDCAPGFLKFQKITDYEYQ